MQIQDEKMRRLIAQQAAQWHVVNTDGALSAQQADEFMRWLRMSPMHVAEYLAMSELVGEISAVAKQSRDDVDDVLATEHPPARLHAADADNVAHLDEPGSPREHRASRPCMAYRDARGRRMPRWLVAAAALVIVPLALLATTNWWMARTTIIKTYIAHHGQVRNLELPDGTQVKLDSDSAVTIRFNRSARHVTVDRGQVYFKVADDPHRPLSVRAGKSLIRDIGTVFDVYRRDTGTTITVATGHVQVWHVPKPQRKGSIGQWLPWLDLGSSPRGRILARLGPRDRVSVGNNGQVMSLEAVNLRQALAWTQGRIAFDNRPVALVAAEFNRYNDVQIDVADHDVGALHVSGEFDIHSASAFTAFLGSLPGVATRKHGKTVVVYAKGHERVQVTRGERGGQSR